MKTVLSRQAANVSHIRWLAYAAAGAATALVGSNSAEAAIHYSGILKVQFPPKKDKAMRFQLEQHDDNFKLVHRGSSALFEISGIHSGYFRGFIHAGIGNYLVSKLSFGQNISSGNFVFGRPSSNFLAGTTQVQWGDAGVGFIGFRFNSGAGTQYGWARIRMAGAARANAFRLLDYAYADPGEPITAGQISSAKQESDQDSLGWLALGAAGIVALRKSRPLAAH